MIDHLREAQVAVKMVSGDSVSTCVATAYTCNIISRDEIVGIVRSTSHEDNFRLDYLKDTTITSSKLVSMVDLARLDIRLAIEGAAL